MLTLAGKEQQLVVPSSHDVLSQADHARETPGQCPSAGLNCKNSSHTGHCASTLTNTHSLGKHFTVLYSIACLLNASPSCRWALGIYVIQLAAALQHLQLPSPDHAEPGSLALLAVAPATLLPGACLAGDQLGPHLAGAAASPSASPIDIDLLEKAYQLYQDTCLSSDPLHSWAGHVEDSLRAAQTFHAHNMQEQPGDHAIGPEVFCKFAIAYIHGLGVAGSADKLSSIQQTTKRQRKKSNAGAWQPLYAAATAALQVVYDKELSQLESSAQRALQGVIQEHAAELAATRPEAEVAEAPSALPAAISLAPHDDNLPNAEAQSADVGATEPMKVVAQAEPASSPATEVLHKELLLALLGLLRKLLALWKSLGSKDVDLLQGQIIRADTQSSNLLSR